jgi:hypothetical protein
MSLTQEELQEIANFNAAANSKFTGLLMDDSPGGRANANSIISHLYGQGLPLTVSNLDQAVVSLQYVLFWSKGNEPVVSPSDTRSTRAPRDTNNGVPRYEGTQYTDRANGIESSWAKSVRLEKETKAQKDAAKEKANRRFKETNQVVQNKVNGGVDYAASNALNEEARRRHAAEDAQEALAAGKPIPVAATTKFRVIPAGTVDFTGYSAEELKAYLARSKGRVGEPHGSLLR